MLKQPDPTLHETDLFLFRRSGSYAVLVHSSDAKIQAQLKQFGASDRRELIAKGITQEKLAELVDLNIRSVQKIEAGQINVLMTTTMRIPKELECP